jgi:TRAP-type transport system small permease protein
MTTGFLNRWWRIVRFIGHIERLAGVTLIAAIVVTITIQVITRYFFGRPLVWVEELAQYSFIWMVFIGAALGFKELRHIRIDTVVEKLPLPLRSLWRAALYLLMTSATLLLAFYAWDIMAIEGKSNTVSLPIEVPRMWFYSIPMCVSMLSISFTGLYFVAAYSVRAMTGLELDAERDVLRRRLRDAEDEAIELAKYDAVAQARSGAAR